MIFFIFQLNFLNHKEKKIILFIKDVTCVKRIKKCSMLCIWMILIYKLMHKVKSSLKIHF